MFIPMKTSKNLCYNGMSDGKRRNPLVSGCLDRFASLAGDMDFAIIRRTDETIRLVSGGLDCFASLAMAMKSTPYTLPVVCTRKFYKNK